MIKAQLLKEHEALKQEYAMLKFQYEQLRKLVFASKSERKPQPVVPEQLRLFEDEKPVEQPKPESTEVKSHKRRKGKAHPGRNPLPEHLP